MTIPVVFGSFDVSEFWDKNEYAEQDYTDAVASPEVVATVERSLGYDLPKSYIELAENCNGGMPINTCHRTTERTTWADDHIAITGIFSIDTAKTCSLSGEHGSKFYIAEWGYPPIGVYFADCPSAGHDMLCLDYRHCGPHGEPKVVHVDQEWDYKITSVATNFELFIRGLEHENSFAI